MLLQSHDGAVHLLPALPEAWTEGEVKGLKARGNFTVDMDWSHGQLANATVRSNIGGNLRLRSYVPLEGEGLVAAGGDVDNPLLTPLSLEDAIVSDETMKQYPMLLKVYEYDLKTEPGGSYKLTRSR